MTIVLILRTGIFVNTSTVCFYLDAPYRQLVQSSDFGNDELYVSGFQLLK